MRLILGTEIHRIWPAGSTARDRLGARPVLLRWGQLALAATALLTGGCALTPTTQEAARAAGFEPVRLPAPPCGWYALARAAEAPSCHVTVVIEGDGRAWARRNRLSRDPTPRRPVGLDVALSLPRPPVAYLARPGQYPPAPGRCETRYWAGARFAPEVVSGAVAAIGDLTARLTDPGCAPSQRRVTLIGYSGGGTLAALAATRADGVAGLVTIATNLDHERWTAHHRVSPLDASLTLWPLPPRLAALPQVHLLGARDRVVPPSLPDRVRAALEKAGHPEAVMPRAAHDGPWVPGWRAHACRAARALGRAVPEGLACEVAGPARPAHTHARADP